MCTKLPIYRFTTKANPKLNGLTWLDWSAALSEDEATEVVACDPHNGTYIVYDPRTERAYTLYYDPMAQVHTADTLECYLPEEL